MESNWGQLKSSITVCFEMSNLFIASYFPALILKVLSVIYKLVQSNTYATKR